MVPLTQLTYVLNVANLTEAWGRFFMACFFWNWISRQD
jgi:hypothetical protein